MHRIFTPDADLTVRSHIEIVGDEARHAVRVKRVGPGDRVGVFDGRGTIGEAVVLRVERLGRSDRVLLVEVVEVRSVEPVRPRVTVYSPAPKGDALEGMIDQLSQVGAAAWGLLRTEHSEREPRKLDRARRATIESAKQCGRAHLLELLPAIGLDEALVPGDAQVVVADADGQDQIPRGASRDIVVLIGPEGGFSEPEKVSIARSGARVAGFGPHVLRIETAAVVAASAMLNAGANPGDCA